MLTYVIHSERGLATISGAYSTAAEWRELFEQILADAHFRPGLRVLRDLRTVEHPVDAATMLQVMAVVREFWPRLLPLRAAMITPREFDRAALTAHALADSYALPLRMFTDESVALHWLFEDGPDAR